MSINFPLSAGGYLPKRLAADPFTRPFAQADKIANAYLTYLINQLD
jgi:hypothetical protein